MIRIVIGLALGSGFFAACFIAPNVECSEIDDIACQAGFVCENFECFSVCGTSFECGAQQACVEQKCKPYSASCDNERDCLLGFYCQSGACARDRLMGEGCGSDNECSTGECVDGVCCEKACKDICTACAQEYTGENDGLCRATLVGFDPRKDCEGDGRCTGEKSCADGELGMACAAPSDCASNFCVDGLCCDSGCEGICASCDGEKTGVSSGICALVLPGQNPKEACGGVLGCNGVGQCDGGIARGGPCTPSGGCAFGLSCVDEVCCDAECDGLCVACRQRLTGVDEGHCAPILEFSSRNEVQRCEAGYGCDGDGSCVEEKNWSEAALIVGMTPALAFGLDYVGNGNYLLWGGSTLAVYDGVSWTVLEDIGIYNSSVTRSIRSNSLAERSLLFGYRILPESELKTVVQSQVYSSDSGLGLLSDLSTPNGINGIVTALGDIGSNGVSIVGWRNSTAGTFPLEYRVYQDSAWGPTLKIDEAPAENSPRLVAVNAQHPDYIKLLWSDEKGGVKRIRSKRHYVAFPSPEVVETIAFGEPKYHAYSPYGGSVLSYLDEDGDLRVTAFLEGAWRPGQKITNDIEELSSTTTCIGPSGEIAVAYTKTSTSEIMARFSFDEGGSWSVEELVNPVGPGLFPITCNFDRFGMLWLGWNVTEGVGSDSSSTHYFIQSRRRKPNGEWLSSTQVRLPKMSSQAIFPDAAFDEHGRGVMIYTVSESTSPAFPAPEPGFYYRTLQ